MEVRTVLNEIIGRILRRLPFILIPIRSGLLLTPPISPKSQVFGTFESAAYSAIRCSLKPGNVFVDIGAHAGYYAIRCARLVKQGGRVIAFEPNPYNYRILRANIAINRLKNIIPVESAVSNYDGYGSLHIPRSGPVRLTDQGTLGQSCGTVRVPVVMLDSVLGNLDIQPNVMKIDVEGAETEVIEGALRTLSRGVQLVVIELHSTKAAESIIDLLSDLRYFALTKGKFLFLLPYTRDAVNTKDHSGGIAIRRKVDAMVKKKTRRRISRANHT